MNAYRRIVDIMRAEGVTNVAYIWHSYAAPTYKGYSLTDCYPGDEYVDWVGISLFGHMYAAELNAEGDAVFEFARDHAKPVIVSEASPIHGIERGNRCLELLVCQFPVVELPAECQGDRLYQR